MVKAIFDGRKTQTRRVINPQPDNCSFHGFNKFGEAIFYPHEEESDEQVLWKCPYGVPGDRLWVRETWCPQLNIFGQEFNDRTPFYKDTEEKLPCGHKWKPSIFMPRWASRITLEITDVSVVRLQEISRTNATEEGFHASEYNGLEHFGGKSYGNAQLAFRVCWDFINKKYPWDSNPWVWVISCVRKE